MKELLVQISDLLATQAHSISTPPFRPVPATQTSSNVNTYCDYFAFFSLFCIFSIDTSIIIDYNQVMKSLFHARKTI